MGEAHLAEIRRQRGEGGDQRHLSASPGSPGLRVPRGRRSSARNPGRPRSASRRPRRCRSSAVRPEARRRAAVRRRPAVRAQSIALSRRSRAGGAVSRIPDSAAWSTRHSRKRPARSARRAISLSTAVGSMKARPTPRQGCRSGRPMSRIRPARSDSSLSRSTTPRASTSVPREGRTPPGLRPSCFSRESWPNTLVRRQSRGGMDAVQALGVGVQKCPVPR